MPIKFKVDQDRLSEVSGVTTSTMNNKLSQRVAS